MDDRGKINRACLELLGWMDLKWWESGCGHWRGIPPTGCPGQVLRKRAPHVPSSPALVVPLADALADAGWNVNIQSRSDGYWYVYLFHLERPIGRRVFEENTKPLELCLALATARAVGTEQDK